MKTFFLRCSAGKTARVGLPGAGGALRAGQAVVLLPAREGEPENAPAAYFAPVRQALIDSNPGHVMVVVCESDYEALQRGIEYLPPPLQ